MRYIDFLYTRRKALDMDFSKTDNALNQKSRILKFYSNNALKKHLHWRSTYIPKISTQEFFKKI